ncbi:hypothetical protein DCAR_0934067 [Daucus carota subsp. sativus]|uniref:Uncharacterized protein n=1 Tax=Daucus carota subsp. sativus TaxID=79200 RepID=A0A175YEP2_DAUCS|nr:PREDICTED: B3 domain-containing protein Os04g0386900-like [Daucus carota subsp. sativus]WOH14548.1 hypothetical protein DCAR_0934067 [Daucus carota subsp. sativus]
MDSLQNDPDDIEASEDEFWPLSDKPNFNLVVKKTQLKPQYTLYVPAKMSNELPTSDVPVVLTYRGKKWKTRSFVYPRGDHTLRTSIRWREFVIDNNLQEGDACVFELAECSESLMEIKVQILRGDFPSQLLLASADGTTADKPIVL